MLVAADAVVAKEADVATLDDATVHVTACAEDDTNVGLFTTLAYSTYDAVSAFVVPPNTDWATLAYDAVIVKLEFCAYEDDSADNAYDAVRGTFAAYDAVSAYDADVADVALPINEEAETVDET